MMKLNVLPVLPSKDSTNSIFFNGESSGNLFLRKTQRAKASYFNNVVVIKLRHSISLPKVMTLLENFVAHIISLRSKKEMSWIHASTVVAFMKDAHSVWNFTDVKLIRKPMSIGVSRSPFSPYADTERTISALVSASSPIPTTRSFMDEIKESIDHRLSFWTRYHVYGILA